MIILPKLQFLDLSHYSMPLDWDALLENEDLIALGWKASQSTGMVDRYFDQARHFAQSKGLLFLAYHFGDATDIDKQIEHFFDVAQPDSQMRLALDWEDNPRSQMSAVQAADFLVRASQKLGRKITCYTGNTARDLLGSHRVPTLGQFPLWCPRYSVHMPDVQPSWARWDIWQYAADGNGPEPRTAKGVQGHPDCNVFADPTPIVKINWPGAPILDAQA